MTSEAKKSLIPDAEEDADGGCYISINEVEDDRIQVEVYFDERHQDPGRFGLLLADGLRHVARAYAEATDTPEEDIVEHIMTTLVDEICNPSDRPQTMRLM
jgi:hypothetical protein